MTAMQLIFLVTAMITLFSAVMTVTSRRMLHSALWLILSLLGVAVVYVLLEASFFAVVQVLVYIGAIAILILFAIMLTRKSMVDSGSQTNRGWLLVMLIIGVACAGMVLAFLTWPALTQTTTALPYDEKNMVTLGQALVSPQGYLIPFEATSILLLAALVGAIYTAVERKEKLP